MGFNDSEEVITVTDQYDSPNIVTPFLPVRFDAELCTGCNSCVDACHTDLFVPNVVQGSPPVILYPDECWFCGSCVDHCPINGAIRMEHPLHQKVGWKRKANGTYYRIGMKNPPPPNTKPAAG